MHPADRCQLWQALVVWLQWVAMLPRALDPVPVEVHWISELVDLSQMSWKEVW